MVEEFKQVPVHILGKEYLVGCRPQEFEELVQSARMLDRTMREIRDSGRVVGTERIAVMAALNLAHELIKSSSTAREGANARLRALQSKIDAALSEEDRQLKL